MKRSLRLRLFGWLCVALVGYYLIYAAGIFAYNRFETLEQHHDAEEEFQEFLTLVGLGLLMLPIMLGVAWEISRRMLQPLRAMADTARRIGEGALAERISVPDAGDEMGSLATTLNGAFDRFHGAVRRLEQFASDTSHQLRNPLMGLRTAGEVALQLPRTADEYRQTIVEMLEEVERLHRVVVQLLAVARLDAARLRADFAPFRASELATHIVNLRRPQALVRQVTLDLAEAQPVSFFGNRVLLLEALGNLVDNAIRHSPEGGRVTIQIDRADRWAEWRIRDQGPGIPAEKLPGLFQRFHRGDHEDYSSAGLGLSIAAEIASLHQGTLTAGNHAEGGAEFVLRLPAVDGPALRPAAEPAS